MSTEEEKPWHAAFPEPTMTVDVFPQRRALMVLSMKIASMLIVDVRRNDYEGGFIRGSINIPAQGFWWNRGILYELAYKSDIEWVVFTCGSCKEMGRGWRCAAWFLDHVRNTVGDKDMQVMVLEGGLKNWVKGGKEYTQFMDGFDEHFWQEVLKEPKVEENKGDATKVSQSEEQHSSATQNVGDASTEAPKEKVWSWERMME